MVLEYLSNIVVVFVVVLLNAFFVAAEFAIVKVRSTQIEPLVEKGNKRAAAAKQIILHMDAYLSATQLGITMTSLALGWIGEPLVASMLKPLCTLVGLESEKMISAIAITTGFAVITFLHITLGEQAPKWLAIRRARGTALFVSLPLRIFFAVFKPIIIAVNSSSNWILKVVGFGPVSEIELAQSQEELRLLLSQDKRVSATNRNIVLNAMDFRRKQARHVMVSRKEIVGLSLTAPIRENVEVMRDNKYSRYPVYRDTIDNIIGVIHTKDVFRAERHLKPDFKLEAVMREVVVLPETATLEQVLEAMLQKKTHLIPLADEFGGTAGIITMENVLEELVGNIQDEFDKEAPEIIKVSDTEYVVRADITTSDVERLLNQQLFPQDIQSIGAVAIERLGHIPKRGEKFRVDSIEFSIESTKDRVIDTIRIRRMSTVKAKEHHKSR